MTSLFLVFFLFLAVGNYLLLLTTQMLFYSFTSLAFTRNVEVDNIFNFKIYKLTEVYQNDESVWKSSALRIRSAVEFLLREKFGMLRFQKKRSKV